MVDFLIIGAEKSGTTWLYENLKSIESIYFPDRKELNFFNKYNSFLEMNPFYNNSLRWYMNYFNNKKQNQVAGEASPMYLCDKFAYKKIHEFKPDIKLIVILRNPVYRAYSQYWYIKRKGYIDKQFSYYINNMDEMIIKRSFYAEQLEKYYKLFPKKNILVLDFDMISEAPETLLSQVTRFLGIDYENKNLPNVDKKVNQSFEVKNPFIYHTFSKLAKFIGHKNRLRFLNVIARKIGLRSLLIDNMKNETTYSDIDQNDYDLLVSIYKDDIIKLTEMTDMNFSKWLKNDG